MDETCPLCTGGRGEGAHASASVSRAPASRSCEPPAPQPRQLPRAQQQAGRWPSMLTRNVAIHRPWRVPFWPRRPARGQRQGRRCPRASGTLCAETRRRARRSPAEGRAAPRAPARTAGAPVSWDARHFCSSRLEKCHARSAPPSAACPGSGVSPLPGTARAAGRRAQAARQGAARGAGRVHARGARQPADLDRQMTPRHSCPISTG